MPTIRVFSWGEGDDGKLGHCSRLSCDKPRLIEALKSKRVRDIACGSSHSAAITSSGELYTWGCGEYGRLGHGDNVTQLRPKQVRGEGYVFHAGKFYFLFSSVVILSRSQRYF